MVGEEASPPSCILSKGGSGVVGEEGSPSVLCFEQGREDVGWLEDKPPPLSCVSSKGGGWASGNSGVAMEHYKALYSTVAPYHGYLAT